MSHEYRPSEYVGICFTRNSEYHRNGRKPANHWRATRGRKVIGYFATEREAAIAYDKHLISIGKKPVNILKPKP